MTELDTLHVNKFTLNSGYIFFDCCKKTKKMKEALIQLHIPFNTIIFKAEGRVYYGFKVFRIKKKIYELCVKLKEVLE